MAAADLLTKMTTTSCPRGSNKAPHRASADTPRFAMRSPAPTEKTTIGSGTLINLIRSIPASTYSVIAATPQVNRALSKFNTDVNL